MNLTLLTAAALTLVAAAAAFANVFVYRNNFSSRGEVRELSGAGAGACDKTWRRGQETLKMEINRGPRACLLRLPVQGDNELPDHDLRAEFMVLSETPRSVRDAAYAALIVRSGGGEGYELRVFPRQGRFALTKTPDGPAFPEQGNSPDIHGIGKRNVLRLQAFGTHVRAFVNGTKVADVDDPDPGDLEGTRLRVGLGHSEDSGKNVVGVLDNIRLAVPNP